MKYVLILLLIISGSVYGVEASYDRGSELILVERAPVNPNNRKRDSYWELQVYSRDLSLYAIYWNPSDYQYDRVKDESGAIKIDNIRYESNREVVNSNYYYVKDGSRLTKTNNIRYKLDPKRFEQTLEGISLDDELLYAGYISSNERLYINKNTKEQYIKVLEPIINEVVFIPWQSYSYQNHYPFSYLRDPVNGQIIEDSATP
ncbi:MAG: hypothetical protein ACRC0X_03780 [Brevinema sp.]